MEERITQAVYKAIDEVNKMLPAKLRLDKTLDTVILGEKGKLDSLGFVNLIVATEMKIEEDTGVAISLIREETISSDHSPFETVKTLSGYINFIIKGK